MTLIDLIDKYHNFFAALSVMIVIFSFFITLYWIERKHHDK